MKQLRERTNKRAEEIAAELGVALATVRFWEQGHHEPRITLSAMPKLLEVYQCSLEEIVQATLKSQKSFQEKNE